MDARPHAGRLFYYCQRDLMLLPHTVIAHFCTGALKRNLSFRFFAYSFFKHAKKTSPNFRYASTQQLCYHSRTSIGVLPGM
jgi:hypothetical protein